MSAEYVAIEIHDSELLSLDDRDSTLVVTLAAYVHRSLGRPGVDAGTGWTETAHIFVARGRRSGPLYGLPMNLDDGFLEAPTENLHNELPTDRIVPGPVRLVLRGFNGETVSITGDHLEVRLQGDSAYVEDFPGI